MVLGIDVDFILDRTGKKAAEDGGFMGRERIARLVVSDGGVFAEGDAHGHDLFFRSIQCRSGYLASSPTFCAKSAMCCRTRLLQAGWYRIGKLQGSRNVTTCDSRG